MDYETLIYEHDEHVVTLTYNRPDQHNAVNRKMNAELHHAWQRFRDDDDAFVLIITGAGPTTFCSGWDLGDAATLTETPNFDELATEMSLGELWYNIGEDELARAEKELDALTRAHVDAIDEALKRKEAELLEV